MTHPRLGVVFSVHRMPWRGTAVAVAAFALVAVLLVEWVAVVGDSMLLGIACGPAMTAALLASMMVRARRVRALVCARGFAWQHGGGEDVVAWDEVADVWVRRSRGVVQRVVVETWGRRRIRLPPELEELTDLCASLDARWPVRMEIGFCARAAR